jgi:hypothetical protein
VSRFLCLSFFAAAKKVSACPAQGRTLIIQYQIKERPTPQANRKPRQAGKNQEKPTAAGKKTP